MEKEQRTFDVAKEIYIRNVEVTSSAEYCRSRALDAIKQASVFVGVFNEIMSE